LDATEDLQCCSTYPLYAQVLSNFAKPPAEAAAAAATTTTTKEGNNKGTAYIITDTSIGFFSSKHRAVQTPNLCLMRPRVTRKKQHKTTKKKKNENKTQTTITTTTTIMSKR